MKKIDLRVKRNLTGGAVPCHNMTGHVIGTIFSGPIYWIAIGIAHLADGCIEHQD